MRKSTLLLGLLVAGSAAAADYVDPVVSTVDAPKYYKVVSNRALTLQYANVCNADGEALATTNTAVTAGQGTYGTRPYIGLYDLDKAAISWDAEIVPNATLLWRFEAAADNTTGALSDGVMWINLFSQDRRLNANGTAESNLAALTKDGSTIYVHALGGYEGGGFQMDAHSYSISKYADPFESGSFDVKNYVGPQPGMSGEILEHPYTFIGANWQPFSDFGYSAATQAFTKDPNLNNGSMFYFEAATDEEVAQAKLDLVAYEKKVLEEKGHAKIEAAKADAEGVIVGFTNVPALWSAADIAAAKAKIDALPLNINDYNSITDLNDGIEEYAAKVDAIAAELAVKPAGKVVSFKNVARPYQGVEGEPYYLGFGEVTIFDEETGEEKTVSGIMGVDESTPAAHWALIAAEGGLKLKNVAYDAYPIDTIPATYHDWGFTLKADSAAVMQLVGVNTTDEDVLAELSEITNVVGIGVAGKGAMQQAWIHAAGSGTNYNVVSWYRDNFGSASNWIVKVEDGTGINSVATDNVEATKAIYDLSGRQINAITRSGLYIINGKKVLVKK